MNRNSTSKPARRAPRGGAGFTPQQMMVLIVVAVLGFTALGLAGYALLFPAAAAPVPAAVPSAAPTALAEATPAPENAAAPILPAACLQESRGIQQGRSARVVDSRTIEAQVDGSLLRIRYAGLQIPDAGPLHDLAVEAARALVDGQDVLLVQDPHAPDAASGETPARYIVAGGRFLNLELVQQGLGQADPSAPEQRCANLFLQAEQQARAEKIGLWQPKRVPTATFMPFVTLDPSRDAPCDCISRPVCSDFRTRSEAQACYNACNDYNSKLDEDRDGIACEGLP